MSRTVVITGATGATGRAAASAFAASGDSLVLLARRRKELELLAAGLNLPPERVLVRPIDLLDGSAVESLADEVIEHFGRVDILIHLVGGWTGGKPIEETPSEDLAHMLGQHAQTTFALFHALIPHLASSANGRMIGVSSPIAARPTGKLAAYAAGKAAEEALFFAAAEELKNTNVTSNLISVKAIDAERKGAGTTLEEIIAAMMYLCSSEAAKISGARIPLY